MFNPILNPFLLCKAQQVNVIINALDRFHSNTEITATSLTKALRQLYKPNHTLIS